MTDLDNKAVKGGSQAGPESTISQNVLLLLPSMNETIFHVMDQEELVHTYHG